VKFLIFSFVFCFGMWGLIRYVETRSLYFPIRELEYTPQIVGLRFEDVFFNSSDSVKLHGWFMGQNGGPALLLCHGNGGNISHRVEKAKILHELGLDVFIFDYRGYGQSEGKPSEAGLYKDVRAAYEVLLARGIKPESIIIYGFKRSFVFGGYLEKRAYVRQVIDYYDEIERKYLGADTAGSVQ